MNHKPTSPPRNGRKMKVTTMYDELQAKTEWRSGGHEMKEKAIYKPRTAPTIRPYDASATTGAALAHGLTASRKVQYRNRYYQSHY
jgi:hypothetical protein